MWPIGEPCVVCHLPLDDSDGFCAHARLGKAWCWGHEQEAINAALGEDISGHTLLWHMPRRDSGGIDGGFLLAFAVILAVVLVYVAAGGAR